MKTDAQKRAQNKWDQANMKMVAVKLRKEEAEEFEACCTRNGTTRMAVLRQAVRAYIAEHSQGQPSEQA